MASGRTYPPRGRGRGESKTSPRRVEAVLKQAVACKLRVCGASYAEIAYALGYRDPSGAWRAIDAALRKARQEPSLFAVKNGNPWRVKKRPPSGGL